MDDIVFIGVLWDIYNYIPNNSLMFNIVLNSSDELNYVINNDKKFIKSIYGNFFKTTYPSRLILQPGFCKVSFGPYFYMSNYYIYKHIKKNEYYILKVKI